MQNAEWRTHGTKPANTNQPRATVPPQLASHLRHILWLFGIAIAIVLIRDNIFRDSYPYNTFLYLPSARFNDFTNPQARFEHFGTPEFFARAGFPHSEVPFVYLPISSVLGLLIFQSLPGYLLLLIFVAILLAAMLAVGLRRAGLDRNSAISCAFIALVSSYPLAFLIDRANIEGVTWLFVSAGLIACYWRRWSVAATFIALATAMKIFPAVLFALLVSRSKWWQVLYGMALTVLVTWFSLWIIGPTIGFALQGTFQMLNSLGPMYVIENRPLEWPFVHSLYSLIKQGEYLLHTSPRRMELIFSAYNLLTPILGLVLYFGPLRKRPMLNQVIALTACSILLPWWSADYTLVQLYVPWGLLMIWIVDMWNKDKLGQAHELMWYLIPFAVLFTPQSYLILRPDFAIGGQIKAIALVALIFGCLKVPLPVEGWDDEGKVKNFQLRAP
jgi:hypothetical protein